MTTANFFNRQRAFPDIARRFALGMGITPEFRGFAEDVIGRHQLPFAIGAATGTIPRGNTPLQEFIQDPANFEFFLNRQNQASPDTFYNQGLTGQYLRQASNLLRQGETGDIRTSQGQGLLRDLLAGPSGSVGSELFAPTIAAATEDTGSRFLPGLGAAARRAVANALQTMLARNPENFTSVPQFIDFLAQQGVI